MLKRHSISRRISRFDSQSLMSSAAACTDPLRSLHTRSIGGGFFVHRLNPMSNGLFKVYEGGGKTNGLTTTTTVRSCFDASPHKKADLKARALSLHRRLLHGPRGEEQRRGGGGTTDLADGRGAYTTRLQGNDKIVVAVDIDEGIVMLFPSFFDDHVLQGEIVLKMLC